MRPFQASLRPTKHTRRNPAKAVVSGSDISAILSTTPSLLECAGMNRARKGCPCCAVSPSGSCPFSLLLIVTVPAALSAFPIAIILPSGEHCLRCWLPMRFSALTLIPPIRRLHRPKASSTVWFEANRIKRPCRPHITSRTSILCIRASKIFIAHFAAPSPRNSRAIFNGSMHAPEVLTLRTPCNGH